MADIEPTADDLKAFGYAPGHYVCRCIDCKDNGHIGRITGGVTKSADKRAWRCEEHATAAWKIHLSNKDRIASTEALQDRIASLQAENTHWCSVANQRALDLAAERDRVRGLEGALRLFTRCAYPVSTSINPRGYGWMPQKDLDYALSEARKALGEG